jgi:hypothetical protein
MGSKATLPKRGRVLANTTKPALYVKMRIDTGVQMVRKSVPESDFHFCGIFSLPCRNSCMGDVTLMIHPSGDQYDRNHFRISALFEMHSTQLSNLKEVHLN